MTGRSAPSRASLSQAPAVLRRLPGWSALTPFQQAVLSATYRIPKGETRSYTQVARAAARLAHRPSYARAVRAVGSALARNPYAPQVPCHRVLPCDGSLGRYSGPGGGRAKRRMLEVEGVRLGARRSYRSLPPRACARPYLK